MAIRRFEDIEAWQLARELTKGVYELSREKPFSSDWDLQRQIRSAASSAMHNIAEGFDAGSNAEFVRFLRYAQRSCTEVQSQLYVALDERYVSQSQFGVTYQLASDTRGKCGGLIRYLQDNPRD